MNALTPIALRSVLFSFLLAGLPRVVAETIPETDQRAVKPKDLNTPREFPKITSRADWEARAKNIREHNSKGVGTAGLRDVYDSAKAAQSLRVESDRVSEETMVEWLAHLGAN